MASTGEAWRLGRRPALDGLRGIAIALVVVNHAAPLKFPAGGTIGVTVFFVLSGFLITSLLAEEIEAHGKVDLARFYRRRALRLAPALLVFLFAVATAVTLGADLVYSGTALEVFPPLFYVENWLMALKGPETVVTHTWSLGIEEQFYLVWPPLLLFLWRKIPGRWLAAVVAVAAVASVARGVLMYDGHAGSILWIYYAFDTRANALLAGCALALWMRRRSVGSTRPWLLLPALGVLFGWCFATGAGRNLWAPYVAVALTVVMIVAVVRGRYEGWLTHRWLVLLGQRSYGLYVWQPLVFFLLLPRLELVMPGWAAAVVAIGAAWLVALASWRWVETPFLRLKDAGPSRETAGLVSATRG